MLVAVDNLVVSKGANASPIFQIAVTSFVISTGKRFHKDYYDK